MQQSRFSKVTAQILVIGISLAFIINFGPQAGTACAPQTGPAATADGLKISAGEYNRFYRQRFEQERSQRKGFDEAKAKAEGFPQRIAEELVDQRSDGDGGAGSRPADVRRHAAQDDQVLVP